MQRELWGLCRTPRSLQRGVCAGDVLGSGREGLCSVLCFGRSSLGAERGTFPAAAGLGPASGAGAGMAVLGW